MPLYSADALILRTYKLGEADRIVVFLTADRGKRRGVAKGARRVRSRFSGGLEPFTHARVAYVERENRDLVRLTDLEMLASPLLVGRNDVLGYSSYFAELVDAWALEGDPANRVFRLGASISGALAADVPIDRIARYFEYWLLRLQGVYPPIAVCHRCGAELGSRGAMVGAPDGAFLCWACHPVDEGPDLSPDALRFLGASATVGPDDLGDVALSPVANRELSSVHRRLIATHLEKELKSARVLRELETAEPEGGAATDSTR